MKPGDCPAVPRPRLASVSSTDSADSGAVRAVLEETGRRVRRCCALIVLLLVGPAIGKTGVAVGVQNRLFGPDRIASVELEVSPAGFHQLQIEPRRYVPALVRVDGQEFSHAQVHLKGHGSFRPITDKPNLMVRLDSGTLGKKAFGHKRLLLDNSSQDPSWLRWKLASELFLKIGLPAARVNFAALRLNGRDLGLYLMVEPTDKVFLSRHFTSGQGHLYEGSNTDVEDKLQQHSGQPDPQEHDLQELAGACREVNLQRRWDLLREHLDVARFASFMAMEVLVCHHDGYCLDRNNFRIYHDPGTDRMVFIPHGMDLIFDRAKLPLNGNHWRGTVARAFMQTEPGRRLYLQRVADLATRVYGSKGLTNRINELARFLLSRTSNNLEERNQLESAIAELQRTIETRAAFVLRQKSQLEP